MGAEDRLTRAWVWENHHLRDGEGRLLASVAGDVLNVKGAHLLVERSSDTMTFKLRATDPSGVMYSIKQSGFTVSVLNAVCADKEYHVARVNRWRKTRIIRRADTQEAVARTEPLWSGAFGVYSSHGITLRDLAFLSYACMQVDQPHLHTRI